MAEGGEGVSQKVRRTCKTYTKVPATSPPGIVTAGGREEGKTPRDSGEREMGRGREEVGGGGIVEG